MKVKIMVAAHRKFPMPKDTDLYLPVLVGAKNNHKSEIKYQRDDEGENISFKNPNYNELTAIYWAWKNLNADAVGLVHYRRFLSLHKKRNIDSILDKEEVENLLEKVPIILPKQRNYYIETNYSHYVHAHHEKPLDMTRKIIEEKHPEYVKSFDKIMHKKKAHMFNMFIMKQDLFSEYAKWLFSVLFEVEKRIDINNYSVQETRVFGYVSELLLDVWIDKNHYSYVETNWIQLGKKQTVKKILSFIGRKVGFVKQTHF
ncbi:exopolysaccharide biosynthesis protein [Pediococcus damnosus]|uniref:DUF4422 domain-containing protein n=1 Tax=Pediococcus damnosus TaxID=51663 RepID=UPI000C1C90F1|nr:DUF4422 domain-containing protein [Pediococcus damnosus]PIO80419.1 exopolysaccharide biosynthesis protein [Pediococcus damnosus]